jgi:hypothetical protein
MSPVPLVVSISPAFAELLFCDLPVSDYLTLGCHEEGGAVPLHQRLCGVDQRQAIRNSILNKCPIIY